MATAPYADWQLYVHVFAMLTPDRLGRLATLIVDPVSKKVRRHLKNKTGLSQSLRNVDCQLPHFITRNWSNAISQCVNMASSGMEDKKQNRKKT